MITRRPHVLGVDDSPFDKRQRSPVPIVGVMMEGAAAVESIAVTGFPVDGDDATGFLETWIGGLNARAALQVIALGGITIAGLGVVDIAALSAGLDVPVLSVTRGEPRNARLLEALEAAGLPERRGIVERSPRAIRVDGGAFVTHAGLEPDDALAMVHATRGKSNLPEALRVAHLVGRALVTGESRGRA